MPPAETTTQRRTVIAEAGIRILGTDGARALTHRRVDAAAGLPLGSTSYYASTRHDLLALIVDTLAERSLTDMGGADLPTMDAPPGREEQIRVVTDAVTALADALIARPLDMRARYLLLLELPDADPLRAVLEDGHGIRQRAHAMGATAGGILAVADPGAFADDLLALLDSLVFEAAGAGRRVEVRRIVHAFLRGAR